MFDKNGGVQALIQYPGTFLITLFHVFQNWTGWAGLTWLIGNQPAGTSMVELKPY